MIAVKNSCHFFLSIVFVFVFSNCSRIEKPSPSEVRDYLLSKYSYSVSIEEAEVELNNFISELTLTTKHYLERTIRNRFSIIPASTKSGEDPIIMHVFNFDNNMGYAIMAGDRRVPPLLCFVEKGQYRQDDEETEIDNIFMSELTGMYQVARMLPDSLKYELSPVSEDVIQTKVDNYVPVDTIYQDGYYYVYHSWVQDIDPIGTIISTQWKQGSPFNDYCPLCWDDNTQSYYRPVAGCTPIAVGQVMAYWQVPTTGTDYDDLDWDYMGSIYDENSAPTNHVGWSMVKSLIVRLGDPENLDAAYGHQTGAYVHNSCRTFLNFGYAQGGEMQGYLMDSVKNALNRGPVLGSGYAKKYYYSDGTETLKSGHTWVFDQYYQRRRLVIIYDSSWNVVTGHMISSGLLHINWGWGGSYDGYFANSRFYATNTGLTNPLSYYPRQFTGGAFKSAIDSIVGIDSYYQYNLEINSSIRPY